MFTRRNDELLTAPCRDVPAVGGAVGTGAGHYVTCRSCIRW